MFALELTNFISRQSHSGYAVARVKESVLTCMREFNCSTGQRRAKPHAFWLVVGVQEVYNFSFVGHAALGQSIA